MEKLLQSIIWRLKVMGQKISKEQMPYESRSTKPFYLIVGDILVQCGVTLVAAGGSGTTITLPKAYADSNFAVTVSLKDPSYWQSWITSITATTITLRHNYSGGPIELHWMTIGKAGA